MKREDLKTGMFVKTNNGHLGLVFKDNVYGEDAVVFVESNYGWTPLNGWNDDLLWQHINTRTNATSRHCEGYNICEVLKPDLPTGFFSGQNKFSDNLTLLWKRNKVKYNIDGIEYSEDTLRSLIKKATQ